MSDARIAALEAAVTELRRELALAQRPRMSSMRATHSCPACGGRTLLRFTTIKDVGHGATHELSLQKDYSAWWGLKSSGGMLEAFACRTCKLVEWHAVSLDDVVPDGVEVIELSGSDESPPSEPYR